MFKIFKWIIFIALLVAAFVLGMRFATGEDNWICKDGKWVKHGNPSAAKPAIPCK